MGKYEPTIEAGDRGITCDHAPTPESTSTFNDSHSLERLVRKALAPEFPVQSD